MKSSSIIDSVSGIFLLGIFAKNNLPVEVHMAALKLDTSSLDIL